MLSMNGIPVANSSETIQELQHTLKKTGKYMVNKPTHDLYANKILQADPTFPILSCVLIFDRIIYLEINSKLLDIAAKRLQ